MLVKIEARILIFPGTDFHFPSTSVPPCTFLGSGIWACGSTLRQYTGKHGSSAPQSTSTYHSTDLLITRGVAHLVVNGTSGSNSYKTIPHVRLETSRRAVNRGHGGATTQRPSLATRTWWWQWISSTSKPVTVQRWTESACHRKRRPWQ